MTNVNCDNCKENFDIKRINTFKIDKGVEKSSFSCPHCSKEYVTGYTDKEIRKLQLEIRRLRGESKNIFGAERERIVEELDKLSEITKEKIRQLTIQVNNAGEN